MWGDVGRCGEMWGDIAAGTWSPSSVSRSVIAVQTAMMSSWPGEMRGRCRGDTGEIQGRCGGDAGEMQGRYRGDHLAGHEDEDVAGRLREVDLHRLLGEIWGDMRMYGEVWGDMRRYAEICGDMGRWICIACLTAPST